MLFLKNVCSYWDFMAFSIFEKGRVRFKIRKILVIGRSSALLWYREKMADGKKAEGKNDRRKE